MKFWVYKLKFSSEVHIGNGLLSESSYYIHADTFFSALCHEILKLEGTSGIDKLHKMAEEDELVLSDGFPYSKDVLYVPKPLNQKFILRSGSAKDGKDSVSRKLWKKIEFLPVSVLLNEQMGTNIETYSEQLKQIGTSSLRIHASILGRKEPEPYGVGSFHFNSRSGIYFFVGIEEERQSLFDQIMESLQYTGIGGKLSSGMGRFTFEKEELDESIKDRLCYGKQSLGEKNVMTLSVSLPEKYDNSLLENSYYTIIKRSGFVASSTYTSNRKEIEGYTKRKDLYVIKTGSCMCNGFCGRIEDVSDGKSHAVLRYVKPLFWRLEQ